MRWTLIILFALLPVFGAQSVKTVNGLAIASVKTVDALAIASVKTVDGLDNTSSGSTVAVDTIATSVSGLDAASIVITTAVVGSGANRLLMVFCGSGDSDAAQREVVSVVSATDGAFTNLASSDSDDSNYVHSEIWYKVAPTTATHVITVTFAASLTRVQIANAISYTGVNQSTTFGTPVVVNGTTASTTPNTSSMTVGTGEMAVGIITTDAEVIAVTSGSGTQAWEKEGVDGDVSSGGAYRSTTGAIGWDQLNNKYAISAVVIKAAP